MPRLTSIQRATLPAVSAAVLAALLLEAGTQVQAQAPTLSPPRSPATALGTEPAGRGAAQARDGVAALRAGRHDDAIRLLTAALTDTTIANDVRAVILNDRGVAQAQLGRARAAIEDYNRAIQLVPESAVLYTNRAAVLIELGEAGEAVRDLDRSLQLDPRQAAAYTNRAVAHLRLGNTRAAMADLTRALQLQPSAVGPLVARGRLHLADRRPHAAIRDFTRALALDGRMPSVLQARAEALISLERYREARDDLTRMLEVDRGSLDALLLRGYAALAARDEAAALRDFERAVELAPRSHAALEARALALAKLGQYEEAQKDLGRAIDMAPRSVQAFAYRSWVFKEMGRTELARQDAERAAAIDPDNPEMLWIRGELLAAAGQIDAAVLDLRRALDAKPTLREAAVALERLGFAIGQGAQAEFEGGGIGPWRIYARAGRFHAASPQYPRLEVPIEMMGPGRPRLLDWSPQAGPIQGIGLLRFHAGSIEGEKGAEETEHIAIVDVAQRSVSGIVVARLGNRSASLTWTDTSLVVVDPEGLKEEFRLRDPREVAQRPHQRQPQSVTVQRYRGGDQVPSWAPWAQHGGYPWPEPRGGSGGERQRQRTLFDLIFKGN